MDTEFFKKNEGFCPDCGSILPPLKAEGGVTCYTCKRVFPAESFGSCTVEYTIEFNSIDRYTKKNQQTKTEDGPVLERKCPKCGNSKMTYATLQLRSADEGQTVFYTCTKCKFKESENS